MSNLPAPLVPAEVDTRGIPIPRDFFARLAVETFGISYAEAIRITNEAADRVEGKKRFRKSHGRQH